MEANQPLTMLERLDQRRHRNSADGGQRAGHFLANGFDLVLKQRHQGGHGLGIADPP